MNMSLDEAAVPKEEQWRKLRGVLHNLNFEKSMDELRSNPKNALLLVSVAKEFADQMYYFEAMLLMEHALILGRHSGWKFWSAFARTLYKLACEACGWSTFARFFMARAEYAHFRALAFMENMVESSLMLNRATILFRIGKFDESYDLAELVSTTFRSKRELFELSRLLCEIDLVKKNYSKALYEIDCWTRAMLRCDPKLHQLCIYTKEELALIRSTVASYLHDENSTETSEKCVRMLIAVGNRCLETQSYAIAELLFTAGLASSEIRQHTRAYLLCSRGYALMGYGQLEDAMQNVKDSLVLYPGFTPASVTCEHWKQSYRFRFAEHMKTSIEVLLDSMQSNKNQDKQQAFSSDIVLSIIETSWLDTLPMEASPNANMGQKITASAIQQNSNALPRRDSTSSRQNRRASWVDVGSPKKRSSVVRRATCVTTESKQDPSVNALDFIHNVPQALEESSDAFLGSAFTEMKSRKRLSVYSYQKLGYANSPSYLQYWETLLEALWLTINNGQKLDATIASVATSSISYDVAACALAECSGRRDEATGKLSDQEYRFELETICRSIDVRTVLKNSAELAKSNNLVQMLHSKKLKQSSASVEMDFHGRLQSVDYKKELRDRGKIKTFIKHPSVCSGNSDDRLIARMYRPKTSSPYHLTSLIDQSIQSTKVNDSLLEVDSWGTPTKFRVKASPIKPIHYHLG